GAFHHDDLGLALLTAQSGSCCGRHDRQDTQWRSEVGQSEWTRGSGSVRPMAGTPDEPARWSVEHDGLTIGALDWGGDGPPLVLLHPNGFCAGVFDPLARLLRD